MIHPVLRLAGLSSQKEDCEMLKLPQTDTYRAVLTDRQTSERLPDFTDAVRLARSYFSPFDQRLFSLLCQSCAVGSQRRL